MLSVSFATASVCLLSCFTGWRICFHVIRPNHLDTSRRQIGCVLFPRPHNGWLQTGIGCFHKRTGISANGFLFFFLFSSFFFAHQFSSFCFDNNFGLKTRGICSDAQISARPEMNSFSLLLLFFLFIPSRFFPFLHHWVALETPTIPQVLATKRLLLRPFFHEL